MGFAITLLLITATIIIAVILWIRHKHNYWQRRNIETLPMRGLYRRKEKIHPAYLLQSVYNKLKASHRPYVAFYRVLSPQLLISDLDVLKFIFITEFRSFPDRGLYTHFDKDPLTKNLVRLHGELWKKVRSKLTPTFTSGKIKMMFANVAAIGKRFVDAVGEDMENQANEVEIRDLCSRFTTDVIGRVAFGLECNSLQNPLTEFRVKGDKAFYTMHPLLEFIASEYPKFFNALGLKVFTKELIDFYSAIVKETVEYRKSNQLQYNDFLDILIELMDTSDNTGDSYLDMEDVIAQAFVFFIGGFETSSSTISCALFELAQSPAVQEKARDNIREILTKHKGEFTYDSLQEMTYIKQIIQETLRKHPPAPNSLRACRHTVTLPAPANLTVYPGEYVVVPIYAIHHDPEYYPEPEIFRPERFAADRKEQRHSMAYLPFGAGPRMCIAERFAMMNTMLGVAMLLENYRFLPCSRTPKKLNFDPNNVRVFTLKEDLYLRVEKA